jgi:chromosome transmission fidelity protein 18
MPSLISSPPTYTFTSSPPLKKRPPPAAAPLTKAKNIGGFLLEEDEDENNTEFEERLPKRQMLTKSGSPPLQLVRPTEERLNGILNTATESDSQKLPPKVVGGFLLDDYEDEEEDEAQRKAEPIVEATQDMPDAQIDNWDYLVAIQAELEGESQEPTTSSYLFSHFADRTEARTCSGKSVNIRPRPKAKPVSYEEMVAARSTTKAGRAKKSYYGIDIHQLVEDAARQEQASKSIAPEPPLPSIEAPLGSKSRRTMMWTEKYRARKFFDLVGDDRTHREVLRWLKGWDPIVFPRAGKAKPKAAKRMGDNGEMEEKQHRKILLLTGPPGLGKTTLAHVCAMQAGYEVMEINASDERSSNVVKGRIRTTVGTESVKTVSGAPKDGQVQKMVRPVCVVVDEVDGVVGGSGGSGEGGFIKALIDLIQLDAKNSPSMTSDMSAAPRRKKKGDDFRLLRPLILICNDVYHPSLRPLRQSSYAEVIHIRKPPLEAAANRLKSVFEKEGIACDSDGVRRLCEATWGMTTGPQAQIESGGSGEGDLRSLLVVGEWVAGRLRASGVARPKLTRRWVEQNVLSELSHGGGGARGVGRGGAKEIVSRVFITGAGFPKSTSTPFTMPKTGDPTLPTPKLHAGELDKKHGMNRLRDLVDTSGEIDRIVNDIFSTYPTQPFNDDTLLSKPDACYEWLHFHDSLSSRVFQEQDWELMPYLSQSVLACHDLFAVPASRHAKTSYDGGKKWGRGGEDGAVEEEQDAIPFSGPRADYDAREAEKHSRAAIQELQSNLSPHLLRSFRSVEDISTHLLPYLVRMLTPDVKPIIVGGSGDQRGLASVRREGEREMVKRAVDVMCDLGVKFERGRLEGDGFGANRGVQWVYRMEPPLDDLVDFRTFLASSSAPASGTSTPTVSNAPAPAASTRIRYAVRQVLDQEHVKALNARERAARQARFRAGGDGEEHDEQPRDKFEEAAARKNSTISTAIGARQAKKDFFGRVVKTPAFEGAGTAGAATPTEVTGQQVKVWVTFHEGFSNAVRKPVTVEEILRGL